MNGNSIDSAINTYIDLLIDKTMRAAEQYITKEFKKIEYYYNIAVVKTNEEVANILSNRFQSTANEVVGAFYADYSPLFYRRTMSLYNAFNVEPIPLFGYRDGYGFDDGFDDDNITHMRGGGSLYEKLWVYGAHGGAYSTGVSRYRTPYKLYYRWSKRPVKMMSPSPQYRYLQKRQEVMSGEQALLDSILNKNLMKYNISEFF